jgi:predicted ATP-grasp superfamily ATP-dependent carboligase
MIRSVLVTDGEQRAALATVRSLGRAGYRVCVCSPRRRSVAGASRYAGFETRTPDPLADPGGFVESVAELVRRLRIDVVLPITEASLRALLPERDRLGVCIPFPGPEAFAAVSDKGRVLAVAKTLGMPVPRSVRLDTWGDAWRARLRDLRYPVVLKPTRSVYDEDGRRFAAGARHASDERRLRELLAAFPPAAYPVLVQERVEGPGLGVFVLLWNGEAVAVFGHRRLRERPPGGGVSVWCESVPVPGPLADASLRLLRALDWNGVAMVEYKTDSRTGTPVLLEINGRFWGSLELAIAAGVDFPRLLLAAALGEPVPPVREYRVGLRARWWWGEVDHVLARLRTPADDLGLPSDAPSRLRAVWDFLTMWRPGTRGLVFRLDDPAPALRDALAWMGRGR